MEFALDPSGLAVTVATGLFAYAGTVVVLRAAGKRTLAKWNAFDFVVTVALGSSLATVILSNQVPPLQGLVAIATLVGLQFAITWLAVRLPAVERVVKARPVALLAGGAMCHETMRRERVSEGEVRAAVRSKGFARLEDVAAVVLETDGSISVIAHAAGEASALADVHGAGP